MREPESEEAGSFFSRVYEAVARVPAGRVASYGQIARCIGAPGAARTVGWALRATPPGLRIPWHRILSASGRLSLAGRRRDLQKALLEAEGIPVSPEGRVAREAWWNPEEEGA